MGSYQAFGSWLADTGTSDVLGFVGFLVTVVGFIATLMNVRKSRHAAEAAREAADEVRRRISTFETVRVLASAVVHLRALQSDQRSGRLDGLPGKYSEIRGLLIGVRERAAGLSDQQRTSVQATISLLAKTEHDLDRALAAKGTWENMVRTNRLLSERTDELLKLSHELEHSALGASDGG